MIEAIALTGSNLSRALILAGAVIADIIALFSFWTCCRVRRSPRWLLTGSVVAAIFGGLAMAMPPEGGRPLLLFLFVYVCAGLLWVWLVERSPPRVWNVGERAVALFGIVLCASPVLV